MTLFVVLHTLICVFLVLVILLQPGKGDAGVGFGSSSQSIFGSKGAGNFLTKTTSVCAFLFLITSFSLTKIRMSQTSSSVITDKTVINDSVPATPSATPESGTETKAAEDTGKTEQSK